MDTERIVTPQPLMKGTFALYDTPDGGRVIAYHPEGVEETSHIQIPAILMRMLDAQARGEHISPFSALKAVLGSSDAVG